MEITLKEIVTCFLVPEEVGTSKAALLGFLFPLEETGNFYIIYLFISLSHRIMSKVLT